MFGDYVHTDVAHILFKLKNRLEQDHYDFHHDALIEARDEIVKYFENLLSGVGK